MIQTLPAMSNFSPRRRKNAIRQRMNAQLGDVNCSLGGWQKPGGLRQPSTPLGDELAKRLGLIQPGPFDLLWITEFPLFEYDEEGGPVCGQNHPFTSPI